jgi:hypothetical protein
MLSGAMRAYVGSLNIVRYGQGLPSMPIKDRLAPLLAAALVTLLLPAGTRAAEPPSGTSHWAGRTKAGCGTMTTDHSRCGAVQNITLTIVLDGSKVSGSYTCAYGNQNCRGMQEAGTISQGTLKGEQLELMVMTPDRSVCRFRGILKHDSGKGSYSCKGGSQLDERGSWRIHSSAETSPASTPLVPPLLRP